MQDFLNLCTGVALLALGAMIAVLAVKVWNAADKNTQQIQPCEVQEAQR